jgi:DNA-binding CsgD family transcriptional regulator
MSVLSAAVDRGRASPMVVGRHAERDAVAGLVAAARRGRGGALLLVGEPGTGKTLLLADATDRAAADGTLVLPARGAPAESGVPYAGLDRLLRPLRQCSARLAPARRTALDSALRLGTGAPPAAAPVEVGAATLDLLAGAARDRPVLLCLDDLQHVDAASLAVLAFVTGRLATEPVAALFASRDPRTARVLADAQVRPLRGLTDEAANTLVTARAPAPVPPEVVRALTARTGGNPQALAELAGLLTPGQLRGTERLPDPLPLSEALAWAYVADLPAGLTELLLVLAVGAQLHPDASMDLEELHRAAPPEVTASLPRAEAAGLVTVTPPGVAVRGPLLRGAVYHAAGPVRRAAVHAALAAGPGRYSGWHRAAVAPSTDERLAADLERTAEISGRVGGTAATGVTDPAAGVPDRAGGPAVDLMERAAELSPDPVERVRRYLAAADLAWRAGLPQRTRGLLDVAGAAAGERPAGTGPDDRPAGTRARPAGGGQDERLAGEVEYRLAGVELRLGVAAEAGRAAIATASRHADRPDLAARALALAVVAGHYAGDLYLVREATRLAATLPPPAASGDLDRAYLAGVAAALHGELATARRLLRPLLTLGAVTDDPAVLLRGAGAALVAADFTEVHALATRALARARATGAAGLVPQALELLAHTECWTGRYVAADGHALDGLRLARRAGQPATAANLLAALALHAAVRADEDECRRYCREAESLAMQHGLGLVTAITGWARGLLDLWHGRWVEAAERLGRLARAAPCLGHPTIALFATPHRVETAVRAGRVEVARLALPGYERWATDVGLDWPRALLARCRALLATGAEADGHYQEALRLHLSSDRDFERGRTALLYAAHLRRTRRRAAARTQLWEALDVFERLGVHRWAEQTRAELRAAGEPLPAACLAEGLTEQQMRVVRLIATGATNRAVAAKLMVSPRTVDYHLRNIFVRLGISSRAELIRRFS